MANLREFDARAALCRRFAKQDPVSRHVWLAEAERWSRLAHARLDMETDTVRWKPNQAFELAGRVREKVGTP